jgi:D-alanyl-D-alanine carboxypeptidase
LRLTGGSSVGEQMVSVRWLVVVVLSGIVVAGCGGSNTKHAKVPRAAMADPARAHKLQEVLDDQRDAYGATGMAAAVVIRGRLFWSGGSGVADRKTNARVVAATPFPVFSISRMFVAALAAKLAQDGQLNLDDPIRPAIPDWANADRITLRMLLNETSGVGGDLLPGNRLARDIDASPRAIWTPRRTLEYARRPHAAPGETWEYNNANYVLAGLVIEHATHRPVSESLRELVLDPLKLRDAVLQPQEIPRGEPAHGYGPVEGTSSWNGGPARVVRALRIGGRYSPFPSEASAEWTAGGMVASAPSVARFADALLRGDLLSRDARRQVLRSVGAGEIYDRYGLGVGEVHSPTEPDRWGQVGEGPGFRSSVWYFPARAITVAVLASGQGNVSQATDLLADTALESG